MIIIWWIGYDYVNIHINIDIAVLKIVILGFLVYFIHQILNTDSKQTFVKKHYCIITIYGIKNIIA